MKIASYWQSTKKSNEPRKRQDDIFNLFSIGIRYIICYLELVLCESFMFRILENFVRKHYRVMWECMYREACISILTG